MEVQDDVLTVCIKKKKKVLMTKIAFVFSKISMLYDKNCLQYGGFLTLVKPQHHASIVNCVLASQSVETDCNQQIFPALPFRVFTTVN